METEKIGRKIADARKKNISQAQFQKHLFISRQAVGRDYAGQSVIDIIIVN